MDYAIIISGIGLIFFGYLAYSIIVDSKNQVKDPVNEFKIVAYSKTKEPNGTIRYWVEIQGPNGLVSGRSYNSYAAALELARKQARWEAEVMERDAKWEAEHSLD